jgi:hypothetical protein
MPKHAALLKKLQQSEVFAVDFPKRQQLTNMEWARLDRPNRDAAAGAAMARMPNRKDREELIDIVRTLAKAKYVEAVRTFAQIWRQCALIPLRTAAGHALRDIGTSEALAALIATIDDADWFSVYMGIRAIFDAAPDKAYNRLIPYFDAERLREPGGTAIAFHALGIFAPTSFSSDGPHWTEKRAPGWLREDRRWLELCVRFRHHETLGTAARQVLRYVEPDPFLAMLAVVQKTEVPRIVVPRTAPVGNLVSRYRQGEHQAVWQELRQFPAIADDMRQEALAVALETMQRVAHNLDLLAQRLEGQGWLTLTGKLRSSLDANDVQLIARIERLTQGPIPPSLVAFWQVVGAVDLVWDYNNEEEPPDLLPGFQLDSLDPLFVDRPSGFSYQFQDWEHDVAMTHPELLDPFSLALAPDDLHKANISGGAPYGVDLPFAGADPVCENERHGLPFVDYLRLSLRWAGFPGLETHASDARISDLVARLTEGFLPF